MIVQNSHPLAVAVGLLVGSTALLPVASGQQASSQFAGPQSDAVSCSQHSDVRDGWAGSTITREQLEVFALVAGEPANHVAERLLLDPGLAPLAIEAVAARTHRLGRGRKMVILGGSGLGAGLVLGVLGAIAMSNYQSPCTYEAGGGCIDFGGLVYLDLALLGGAMAVGGLVVLSIGMIKLDRLSEAEEMVLDRYYPPGSSRPGSSSPKSDPRRFFDPEYSFAGPRGFTGKTFSLPLLSSTF